MLCQGSRSERQCEAKSLELFRNFGPCELTRRASAGSRAVFYRGVRIAVAIVSKQGNPVA